MNALLWILAATVGSAMSWFVRRVLKSWFPEEVPESVSREREFEARLRAQEEIHSTDAILDSAAEQVAEAQKTADALEASVRESVKVDPASIYMAHGFGFKWRDDLSRTVVKGWGEKK